ncbi:MAG: serine protease [Verrucomicrobiaceae bacterium]|nr:MAG: serine protease [Verrucomicrobiaceae bacterium]
MKLLNPGHKIAGLVFVSTAIFAMSTPGIFAQSAGVPIERDEILADDAPLVAKAAILKDSGKLLSSKQVAAALKSPEPARLVLPPPSTGRLEPRVLAERGRKALVRIGWYYHEKRLKQWHVDLADGYAISSDGAVATCHHCVAPEEVKMHEGYLIAADASGNVFPVTAVLVRDKEMDAAIVRVEGGSFTPLPLNDQTAPGDTVYVFSDPMSAVGYFSSGILNRFFWLDGGKSMDAAAIEGARNLRIHVSSDWAPGSSGAAVLDVCGNAVGHVSVIDPLVSDDPLPEEKPGSPGKSSKKKMPPAADHCALIILHEAVSARGVKMLAESMNEALPASPTAK